jgi:hypothetical protein
MKEIKSNSNTVKCPSCGKKASITSTASSKFASAIICFLGICASIWIPIIGWICLPIFIILTCVFVLLGIIGIIKGGGIITCKECNKKYKLTKEEYAKYL